ncbi:probable receptor-like protein kinase At1g49730 isoform X6 [Panicum virgatum]|uniref:probable receptor-like protein kinase At1g49730 isoform X6 n=1 Tax=Panicum virgatum TaxID=38727 RepID=UPI0019D523BF|nr:probable receptor-like protein kinase At1g49730 isoform X6 [Panicum virgatum]
MGDCLRRRLCLGGTRTSLPSLPYQPPQLLPTRSSEAFSGDLPFVRRFTPREIEAATKGFTAVLEAGGGPHGGAAYRARFAGGLVATVRRAAGSRDDHRQQGGAGNGKAAFYLELQLLARLNHRHVVRLRGFAEGHRARFLVFDHMENRSLKECLHDPLRTPLDWRTRLQVAIDIAAALEYLYYFCDPLVFHVSVDSGNVLMDANFVAKLSNVGVVSDDLKRATTESFQDQVEQRRAGLVFQYGVLVLELVTGQSPGGDGELVRWVQEPGFAGSMHRMVDADLGGVYDARELRDLVNVARLCTRHEPGGGGGGGDGAAVSIPRIVRYLQGKVERLGGEARSRCG